MERSRPSRGPGLGPAGDLELAAAAAARLGRHHDRFVVATVVDGRSRLAAVGLPLDAEVEIGSVSKGLAGMLFVDARRRGEVTDATRLGDLLPLQGAPAAAVTLGALSTHRSGLPRLAGGTGTARATWDLLAHGTNPYGETLAELLDQVRATSVGSPRPRYSNVGYMLLGHAVASAAGTTYAALLRERLAAPAGMTRTRAPASPDELGDAAAEPRNRRGRTVQPWTGEALGPAGGVRSTAGDLGALVVALLDGSAPGVAALDPVADLHGARVRIGAAWVTMVRRGVSLTWHNGGTGGFRSVVALDRAAGAGIALVSATTRSVDGAGFALLQGLARPPG